MEEIKNQTDEIRSENDVISWRITERQGQPKTKKWYIIAGIIGILLIAYAIFTSDFIFAVIILICAVLIVITEKYQPAELEIALSDKGVKVGKEFYDYEKIDNFSIVYKPEENIKNLYLEFKRFAKPELEEPSSYEWLLWLLNFSRTRISAPLENMNPLLIRKNLLKYLKEDLERTNIPLSEQLTDLFRM